MKKLIGLIIILMAGCVLGCKGDSDILATYKSGNITRGDFYSWLTSKRIPVESLIKSKSRQKAKLQDMAVELISIEKAKAEGFDKDKDFQMFMEMNTESVLLRKLYEKEIKNKSDFNEPAIKIKHIMLRVKDYDIDPKKHKRITLSKKELDKRVNETVAQAKEIITKLDKGEKFEDLAKQFSQDFSKTKGGDAGYLVRNMMPPEYSEAAFSLKKGEYTKVPVKLPKDSPKSIYIIKVEDAEQLTDKNIEDIIQDKNKARSIRNIILRNYAKEYVDNLLKAEDVKFFESKALSRNKSAVLFNIGDRKYTVENMEKLLELRQFGRSPATAQNKKITDDQKKNMAKAYFRNEVLKRDAIEKGIDKDPEYIEDVQSRTDALLSREYTNKLFSSGIKITSQEIKEEYDKNKDRRYSTMVTRGKKRVRKPKPLSEVKDSIERVLLNRKKTEKRKGWIAQVLQEYEFKTNDSKLEGE